MVKAGEAQVIEDWVEQCRNGQTRAYAKVVQAVQAKILAFLFRMTQDWELAKDLGQETFLHAYRQLDRYDRTKAAFSTWLFTLARNLCLDELRKQKNTWITLENAVEVRSSSNPFLEFQESETGEQIAEAIRHLDPVYREVFILREYENLSLEEVARITECPVGTVKSRLHRARLLLQEKLTPVLKT